MSRLRLPRSLPCGRALAVQATLAVVAIVSLVVLVQRNRGEFAALPSVARDADAGWLTLAVGCEALALATVVERSRRVLRRLGHPLGWGMLARATLRRRAVATILPGGSAPAAVLYTRDLGAVGVPANDAVYSIGLVGIASTLGTVAVLVPGFFLPLAFAGGPRMTAILGAAALATGLVGLGCRRALLRLLPGRGPRRLRAFVADARAHGIRPRDLAGPVALAVAGNAAGIAGYYAALRAVHLQPALESAATARVVGSMATYLAPVFQGTGVVEGSMTAVLQRAGDGGGLALAGTLLYRLVQVWLPAAIGLALLARLPALPKPRRALVPAGVAAALALAVVAAGLVAPPDVDAAAGVPPVGLAAIAIALLAVSTAARRGRLAVRSPR